MSNQDKLGTFLKEQTTNKNKLIFTTDELTDELMLFFKLRNKNTASKYLEVMEQMRYTEYLSGYKWKVLFCNTEQVQPIVKEKPTFSMDDLEEQNYQIYLQLKGSLTTNLTPELLQQSAGDYYKLLKEYINNQRLIYKRKELKQ